MRAWLLPLAAFASLTACGSDSPTAPGSRVPTVGRYAFVFESQPGTLGIRRETGRLTITAATPDMLEGFAFGETAPPFDHLSWSSYLNLASWNQGAYWLVLDANSGLYSLRFWRGVGDDLECTGVYQPHSQPQTFPVTCSTTFEPG